jgi:hypothetical protein
MLPTIVLVLPLAFATSLADFGLQGLHGFCGTANAVAESSASVITNINSFFISFSPRGEFRLAIESLLRQL